MDYNIFIINYHIFNYMVIRDQFNIHWLSCIENH